MIVTGDHVAAFVAVQCGVAINPPFTCMGIERDDELIGGVVFNVFTGPDVHVTVAGHGWTPKFIKEVGRYVFEQLGCIRMTITTEQDGVVSIAKRLGGQVEGTLRDLYGKGRNGTIIGILAADWRF